MDPVILWFVVLVAGVDLMVQGEILDFGLPKDYYIKDGDTFDYIVVGAGAAGIPAASRLAQAGADVLLIEAGGNPSLLTTIPGAANTLLGSDMDWQYETKSNNVSCLSSIDRACRFSRGKALGGSSSINYMMYTRGNRLDFDHLNITGWAWDDVKPYFLRYEGLQHLDKLPQSSAPYHNTTGILKVGYFENTNDKWHPKIIDGFEALNFPYNEDVNAESQIGVSRILGYVYKNQRMSTARAYLTDDTIKKSVKVSRHTLCTEVIIDKDNVARGVKVKHGSLIKVTKSLYARKEVILSAGTIGTPQILMLSGVGPADHLKQMGIGVRVDLPVGEGMSDHVLALVMLKVDPGFGVDAPNLFVYGIKAAQAVEWLATKEGPLANIGLTDVTAFFNTLCYDFDNKRLDHNSSSCELPSSQVVHAFVDKGLIPGAEAVLKNAIHFNDYVISKVSKANVNHALVLTSLVVLRPYSRGTVRLASTDASDHPEITPNYLSDERDVEEMLRSIAILEDLVQTSPYKESNASLLHFELPGCPAYEEDRKGYWRCYCRHSTYSVFHAVGPSALGHVVDPELRVYGVKSLRVADLGVMPELPRGNTEATAVAIGERVAAFIGRSN